MIINNSNICYIVGIDIITAQNKEGITIIGTSSSISLGTAQTKKVTKSDKVLKEAIRASLLNEPDEQTIMALPVFASYEDALAYAQKFKEYSHNVITKARAIFTVKLIDNPQLTPCKIDKAELKAYPEEQKGWMFRQADRRARARAKKEGNYKPDYLRYFEVNPSQIKVTSKATLKLNNHSIEISLEPNVEQDQTSSQSKCIMM